MKVFSKRARFENYLRFSCWLLVTSFCFSRSAENQDKPEYCEGLEKPNDDIDHPKVIQEAGIKPIGKTEDAEKQPRGRGNDLENAQNEKWFQIRSLNEPNPPDDKEGDGNRGVDKVKVFHILCNQRSEITGAVFRVL